MTVYVCGREGREKLAANARSIFKNSRAKKQVKQVRGALL